MLLHFRGLDLQDRIKCITLMRVSLLLYATFGSDRCLWVYECLCVSVFLSCRNGGDNSINSIHVFFFPIQFTTTILILYLFQTVYYNMETSSESFLISFKVGFFICLTLTKRCDWNLYLQYYIYKNILILLFHQSLCNPFNPFPFFLNVVSALHSFI